MPDRTTPELEEWVKQLLAYEAAASGESAARRVSEKLRKRLGKLLGVAGFRVLVSRALSLAGAEVLWLRALQVRPDGALEGLNRLQAKIDKEELSRGEVALVSQLLGLLVTFIGPTVTRGLILDEWPEATTGELNSKKRGS